MTVLVSALYVAIVVAFAGLPTSVWKRFPTLRTIRTWRHR